MKQTKKVGNSTLFQRGTKAVSFFQRGTVSEQKKVENSTPLKKGIIFVPLGALFFLNNRVYETVPLGQWGTEINYTDSQTSAPRGTVSVPFFSECSLNFL